MEYRIAYGTHRGTRANQEDALFLNGEIVQDEEQGERSLAVAGEGLVAAVCDGMGGHAMGDWASRFVCERLQTVLATPPAAPEEVAGLLRGIQIALENEHPRNCGTTIAGVALQGVRALVFNAGDSRVYKRTAAGLVRLTHDHSLVQTSIDRGELTPAAAFRHPHRNVIEFGLGPVFAAVWAAGERAVHCVADVLLPGESYLLCSDGVHDVLGEAQIEALSADTDPATCAAALDEALQGRMADNASFIVVTSA